MIIKLKNFKSIYKNFKILYQNINLVSKNINLLIGIKKINFKILTYHFLRKR